MNMENMTGSNSLFQTENFIKEQVIISIIWANFFGLIVLCISILFFGIPFVSLYTLRFSDFFLFHQIERLSEQQLLVFTLKLTLMMFIILFLSAIHEIIHGLFFALFAESKFKSVKFGIMPAKKLFTLYCHCKEPRKLQHYRIATLMPLVILGILPAMISLLTGNITLLVIGIIMTCGSDGDILLFIKLRKAKKNCWIQDHPTEAGFIVYREKEVVK